MSLFALHQRVMEEYEQFVHSFVQIADARVRAYAEQVIRDERALWPAPMLQLSPAYQYGVTLDALVQEGVLHPDTGRIFRTRTGEPLRLYAHQERALRLASQGRSYVVTSGTGSGKSFTYLIPIIDYLLRHPDERGHVVALIVYPMNALVNSQLRALESLKAQYEQRYGQRFPITFAKYTGETEQAQREEMRKQPPQILLTNYMMGELLMVRREDQPLFGQRTLRFLVFDELHTYRGRQGADVAMLVRRLKERYGAPDLVHIGTSATMVASEDATQAERRQAVAQFAPRAFSGIRSTPTRWSMRYLRLRRKGARRPTRSYTPCGGNRSPTRGTRCADTRWRAGSSGLSGWSAMRRATCVGAPRARCAKRANRWRNGLGRPPTPANSGCRVSWITWSACVRRATRPCSRSSCTSSSASRARCTPRWSRPTAASSASLRSPQTNRARSTSRSTSAATAGRTTTASCATTVHSWESAWTKAPTTRRQRWAT
jgi:hypothetical protein